MTSMQTSGKGIVSEPVYEVAYVVYFHSAERARRFFVVVQ